MEYKEYKKCSICGITEGLELDHIIPLAKGGSDNPENLQWLCKKHNRGKRDKTSYYNFDKEIMEKMISESLDYELEKEILFGVYEKIDPIKSYDKISKVFFILPKDFYDIYVKWKKTKTIQKIREKSIEDKKDIEIPRNDFMTTIDIIRDLTSEIGKNIPLDMIKEKLKDIPELDKIIKRLKENGYIFEVKPNIIQMV